MKGASIDQDKLVSTFLTSQILSVPHNSLPLVFFSYNSDLRKRRELFGRNEFDEPERTSWLQMFLTSFEDTTLIVLIVAAVVSLAVGLYEDLSSGWIEGAAILFAVLLVAIVTATNDYRKEAQFRKLNAKKDDITIGVVRGGISININVKDLVSCTAYTSFMSVS